MSRFVLIGGTRPEFVKLHPLALALARDGAESILVGTNQHRSSTMRDPFLQQLVWPCEVIQLPTGPEDTIGFLAHTLGSLSSLLHPGDIVIVEGDTNSVLAGSLVANKLRLPLAHVEAGLRSYDLRMPEEHNRRICDHLADQLFAPTALDAAHLTEEHCPGQVHIVGNTVLDAVRQNVDRITAPPFPGKDYVLLTVHRQENVDDPAFLEMMLDFLSRIPFECVFPVHPRTKDRLNARGIWTRLLALPNVQILEPLAYLAFLAAMRNARVIVTDSGGVQEEATAPEITRPALIVRRSTERMAAVEAGYARLAPAEADALANLVTDLSWFRPTGGSPFGDGHAAEAIVEILRRYREDSEVPPVND